MHLDITLIEIREGVVDMDKVTKIFLEQLVERARTEGDVPWHKPWKSYNQFNWYTLNEYSGINRWLLPKGEYLTMNQFKQYNESVGFKYHVVKGSKWYPILFVKNIQEDVTFDLPEEVEEKLQGITPDGEVTFICVYNFYGYFLVERHGVRRVLKVKKVRRYYKVADRTSFVDENNIPLPSKIETGEVNVVLENPEKVVNNYITREKIRFDTGSSAFYLPKFDIITVPDISAFDSSEDYYCTVFHEMAHSTGAKNRLNRDLSGKYGANKSYSREEVVAELTTSLLCAETGIQSYCSQNGALYENSVAYVKGWIKYIETTKDDLIFIFSDADKAFRFIMYNER